MAVRSGRIGTNERHHDACARVCDEYESDARALGRARVRQDMRDLESIATRERANEPGHGPARSSLDADARTLDSTTRHGRDDVFASGEHEAVPEEAPHERDGRCSALMRCFFEEAREGIVLFDSRGAIVDANPAACRLFGRPREVLDEMLLFPLVRAGLDSGLFWSLLATEGRASGELELARVGGGTRRARFHAIFEVVPWVSVLFLRP